MPQTPSRCGSQATLQTELTSRRRRHPHRRRRHRTTGRLGAGGAPGVGDARQGAPMQAGRRDAVIPGMRRAVRKLRLRAIPSAAMRRHRLTRSRPAQCECSGHAAAKKSGSAQNAGPRGWSLSIPDASALCCEAGREPMAARAASACSPYLRIPAVAREILPPRGLAAKAPIGAATRLNCRRRKSRRCGSPNAPWRPRWRRRASP